MNTKHYQKKTLIFATIIQVLFVLSAIAAFCIYFFIEPYPEKKHFNELDEEMIAKGEKTTLAIIYFSIALCIVFATINLVFIITTCYRIFIMKLLEDLESHHKKSFV